MEAPTITNQRLSDLTDLITVETGTRRYYWRLGRLDYSRVEDGHVVRSDVVSQSARREIKNMIDEALGLNISMYDSNEEAAAALRAIFG